MNILKVLKYALVFNFIVMLAACNGKKAEETATATAAPAQSAKADGNLVVRYVDIDSLLSKYNLAKEMNEAMMRRQNQFDAAQRQRGGEIQKLANEIQTKYQNNGYLSEASFNADQKKLQKMQQDAETYVGKLGQEIQNELAQNNKQLNDSVTNFLKLYAKSKGYNVILNKAVAPYIDESLDVTEEVVAKLNARYVKVSKED